jgi:hypothetical protein
MFKLLVLGVMGISFHFERNLRVMAVSTRSGLAKPRRGQNIFRIFLYRMRGLAVISGLSLAVAWAGTGHGFAQQEEKPEIVPQRIRPQGNKAKKGNEPRAVGILQLNSNGKGSLIPVAILINGRFYDASAYKADPVPMALVPGTVYEAEPGGDSQGLFTVNGALHNNSAGSATPWVGTGAYLANGAAGTKVSHRAENVPVGIESSGDEGPPRLRKSGTNTAGADSGSTDAGSSGAGSPGTGSGSASGAPAEGTAAKASDKAPVPAPAPAPAPAKDQTGGGKGEDTPGQGASSQTTTSQTSTSETKNSAPSDSKSSDGAGGNYYRPELRRGKPTQSAPEDTSDPVQGAVSGNAPGKTGTGAAGIAAAKTAEPIHLEAAISDAGGPEPQSYKYFWKSGEEDERRNQMLVLAGEQVQAYAAALARNHISAAPVNPKTAAASRKPAKPPKPVLEDVQFRGFDLWLNNQPVVVLTAKARIPGSTQLVASAEPYDIVLVARTDIYGDLKKLYSGVTDHFHLDVAPQLDLIDVVDADGDGLGELLFRKTSDAASGYVIYRATADKLWKLFDSLNPE